MHRVGRDWAAYKKLDGEWVGDIVTMAGQEVSALQRFGVPAVLVEVRREPGRVEYRVNGRALVVHTASSSDLARYQDMAKSALVAGYMQQAASGRSP